MKKELYFPIAAFFIGTAFFVVSILVTLSKGKNQYWVKKKLRLGGMLLYFSAIGSGCEPAVSCYDGPPRNRIWFDKNIQNDAIEVDLSKNNIITGEIRDRTLNAFSFGIYRLDSLQKAHFFHKADLLPSDGKFDSKIEKVSLEIPSDLDTGSYTLAFYQFGSSQIDSLRYHSEFRIGLLIKK